MIVGFRSSDLKGIYRETFSKVDSCTSRQVEKANLVGDEEVTFLPELLIVDIRVFSEALGLGHWLHVRGQEEEEQAGLRHPAPGPASRPGHPRRKVASLTPHHSPNSAPSGHHCDSLKQPNMLQICYILQIYVFQIQIFPYSKRKSFANKLCIKISNLRDFHF